MPRPLLWISLALLLFLSLWEWLPAPVALLYPLAIGGPEVSAWLLLALLFLALFSRRGTLWFWLALTVVLLLSARPFWQSSAVAAQIHSEFPTSQTPSALAIAATSLRGLPIGPSRVLPPTVFATPDGHPLTLEADTPITSGPHPTLIFIHGGSWQNGSPAEDRTLRRYWAGKGFVAISLDYRHAPRYPYPSQIEDIRTGLAFLRQHAAEYNIALTRVVFWGRSAGAHLALLSAYQPDSPLPATAVISYYGPVDLLAGYQDLPQPNPLNVRDILEKFLGGSPSQVPQQYRDASPITYATHPLAPTLQIQGGRDHVVKSVFARQLHARLRQTGTRAILVEIPWAEHAFDIILSGPGNQFALLAVEQFLASVFSPSPSHKTLGSQ